MYTHEDFFRAFLRGMNLPARTAGLRALAGVSIFESSQGDLRWFNPLAVTLPYNGSTPLYPNYKGACAQVYNTAIDGLTASITLFSGPHWADVRTALAKKWWRAPIMREFSLAYTWVQPAPNFDLPTSVLDARLAHPLA